MLLHKFYNYIWTMLFVNLLLIPEHALGSVWSWIMNEPIQHSDSALSLAANETSDLSHIPLNDRSASGAASQRFTMPVTSPCQDSKSCGRGKFCDVLYGRCERVRRRGEFCRKDHHCQRKHECVFGRCRKEVPKGQEGSRCSSDTECPNTHCCARQHGEFICKLRLKLSMKCFVPAGGLDYSLNEQCPCESGLICQYEPAKQSTTTAVTKRPQKNEWFQFSSETEHMRCLPVIAKTSDTVTDDTDAGNLDE